ncbi:hypothetical protein PHPALM_18470 [Phytophthora palmivora]|uniref:Uncharacterized protein n=1 Tax=Phytophthora palmivora TaxID=4796 RepID=A0A2P4XJP8_9STRA|nr:hypothetical protein PHPALM_18470 [Phytophthora palmivora]
MDNPRRAYAELVALDKQLRDLLRADPSNVQAANALRLRLIGSATRLADAHPAFAARKEVEQALWKPCFYRRIEEFRRRIRKAAADRADRAAFARVSSDFAQFLTQAAAFYAHLRDVFSTDSSCRASLYRCYVFLGDLARYRELHSHKAKKNFAAAEALYHRALLVVPENGNPHNQLAVLATYVDAETVAVYRYCRSLLTSQPFTTAEENLALLFERSRQRPLAPPMTFTATSSKDKSAFLKSCLHRLTRMHGILFALSTGAGKDAVTPVYPRDMEAVLFKDMRTLLQAGVVGDALLLKVVVTNVFCIIRASDSRAQTAPLEDALRLAIRTITCVMEFLLDSLGTKPTAGANGKAPKDQALVAFRLAGPKKLYSDVAANDQGAGGDQFSTAFLLTLTNLVNHARIRELYAPLVADAGAHETPSAVREQQHLLKESIELRGFAPLEQDGMKALSPDEWKEANGATPLADAESAKLRAWKLYHFARYLCDGYEGNPLLFRGASGLFTTSPDVGKGNPQHDTAMPETVASINLGFLSAESTKQQQEAQPQGGYRTETEVDEDDDFEDEKSGVCSLLDNDNKDDRSGGRSDASAELIERSSVTWSSMGAAATKSSSVSRRVIRTNVSLEQLVALSRGASGVQATSVETTSTPIDAHGSAVELVEMRTQLLQDAQRMDDFERVKFLEESTRAFEATASSHRPRSAQPVRLPTDKTSAASSTGVGGADEEQVRGRLTTRDLRTLLRLHYETPESWTHEVLADKYGLDVDTMRSILRSVGPPNVLPPKGSSEHPLGVWFDAPESKQIP